MSAFGVRADMPFSTAQCPLLALSGHGLLHCTCLLLTQGGHSTSQRDVRLTRLLACQAVNAVTQRIGPALIKTRPSDYIAFAQVICIRCQGAVMRHASKLACTLCGLIFALLFATDVWAQTVRGTPCQSKRSLKQPGLHAIQLDLCRRHPCGSCRRVSGACAPGCLDGPTSSGLTFFDPLNFCNATCTSQRGQCTQPPATTTRIALAARSCTAGLCQAKTCTTNAACGSQAHCPDKSAGLAWRTSRNTSCHTFGR